ncbi:hypothetical protein ACJMK2_001198 [Sinanodonta woodiana]|uniref:BED-type domain-containing protein n=1 Tax=Sinanodonta woodiana TaxID=1069815 RepID=A0ABD3XTD6_SINWO
MYFTNVETDPSKAQCKECNKLLSLGRYKPKIPTVSGLKGHLASCYKELHDMYLMRAIMTTQALLNFIQMSLMSMAESRMIRPEDHEDVQ